MINLSYCNKLLDVGFSLISVGKNKTPNTRWKEYQTNKISKQNFEKNYNIKKSSYTNSLGIEVEINATENIGICTGFWGVEVIDVDLKVLPSIQKQREFWDEYLGFLRKSIIDFDNKVVIYQTLTGGYHILYRCSKVGGNEKLATLKGYNQAIIETRGVGGYVVIYEKQVSSNAYHNIQEISELDRDTIINCSRYFNYIEPKQENNFTNKKQPFINGDSISPGTDYNNKTNIFDLISSDFEIVGKLKDSTVIRRHGASSDKSGHIFTENGCMYLFSTGTIYPSEELLTPFAVYTYKNHNGNFSDSAKDLYAKGFGSRQIKVPKEIEEEIFTEKLENIEFPLDIFSSNLQKYILECNQTLDSNVDYMGASFLWLMSVIIGNSLNVSPKKGWTEPCTMWLCCVGRAGVGKTPSIRNITFPLKKINSNEIKKYQKEKDKFDYFAGLTKKEQETAEEIKQPKKSQFIVNDITLEALIEMHEESKNSVGIMKDELAGFFKDMNKYRAGSDLEFWLSSWSAEGVSLNRKTAKSSFIETPCLPILGGIQPSILSLIFNEEYKDNGFVDRFLIVYPDSEVEMYNTKEMNGDTIQWYADYITEMYTQVKCNLLAYSDDGDILTQTAVFSDEAKQEWERLYNEITRVQNSDSETEYFKSMLPKIKSYIPRFALIINSLECFDNGTDYLEISKENVIKAGRLAYYFINQAKKVKIESLRKTEAKSVVISNKAKTKREQALEIVKTNKNIKKSEIAEILGVSRQMVDKYLK